MGVVYRAFNLELHRSVALKVFRESSLAPCRPACLQKPGPALGTIPTSVWCKRRGRWTGHSFLVMELVDGFLLSDVIAEGGLSVSTVVRYGTEIAAALAHAHARGIVHRDLKGLNVIIGYDGHAKVFDFGLSTRVPAGSGARVFGASAAREIGSVAGLQPTYRRKRCAASLSDGRSDLRAFGVLLHEMLTGQQPFASASLEGYVPAGNLDLNMVPKHVPAALIAVMKRCLATDRERRYQRAEEVVVALQALAKSSHGTPASRSRTLSLACLAIAGALGVVAMAVLAVLSAR